MNLLFVCSRNKRRSPSAERLARRDPRCQARSAGTSDKARRRVTAADLRWADRVCVMEHAQADRLRQAFPEDLERAKLRVLDIPDDYAFMDPELIAILEPLIEDLIGEGA